MIHNKNSIQPTVLSLGLRDFGSIHCFHQRKMYKKRYKEHLILIELYLIRTKSGTLVCSSKWGRVRIDLNNVTLTVEMSTILYELLLLTSSISKNINIYSSKCLFVSFYRWKSCQLTWNNIYSFNHSLKRSYLCTFMCWIDVVKFFCSDHELFATKRLNVYMDLLYNIYNIIINAIQYTIKKI